MKSMRQRAAEGLKVGDTFRVSRVFTQEEVVLFAKISGDYNPIHFDEAFAKTRNFVAPICHGLLSASLLTEIGGQIGWLASKMHFEFKKPVYIGEKVQCDWVITSIDERGRASAAVVIINESGDVVITADVGGVLSGDEQRVLLQEMIETGDPTNALRGS